MFGSQYVQRNVFPYVGAICYGLITLPAVLLNEVAVKQEDPIFYMRDALDLANYQSAYHPPFYSTVMAVVNVFVNDIFLSGKLVSLLAGIILAILVYRIATGLLAHRLHALAVSFLFGISPLAVRSGYVVGSDMLGAALFMGVAWYLIQLFDNQKRRYLLAAGILAGLAYLTRYVYLGIPVAVIVLLAIGPRPLGHSRWQSIAVFLAAFLFVIAPWSLLCLVRYGDLHNMNHVNMAFAVLDDTNSWLKWEEYERQYPNLLSVIIAHPSQVVRHVAHNLLSVPRVVLIGEVFVPGLLTAIGLLAIPRRPSLTRVVLVTLSLVLLALTLLTWPDPRFFLWMLPVTLILGVRAIETAIPGHLGKLFPPTCSLPRVFANLPLKTLVMTACILVAVVAAFAKIPTEFERLNITDEKKAGEWIKEHYDPEVVVLTSSLNLCWYANREFYSMSRLGSVSADSIEAAVKMTGADIFVYSQRHSTYTHPQLQFLLDTTNSAIPHSWRLAYYSQEPSPVVIYEIGG